MQDVAAEPSETGLKSYCRLDPTSHAPCRCTDTAEVEEASSRPSPPAVPRRGSSRPCTPRLQAGLKSSWGNQLSPRVHARVVAPSLCRHRYQLGGESQLIAARPSQTLNFLYIPRVGLGGKRRLCGIRQICGLAGAPAAPRLCSREESSPEAQREGARIMRAEREIRAAPALLAKCLGRVARPLRPGAAPGSSHYARLAAGAYFAMYSP